MKKIIFRNKKKDGLNLGYWTSFFFFFLLGGGVGLKKLERKKKCEKIHF